MYPVGFWSGKKLGGTNITGDILHQQIFDRNFPDGAQILLCITASVPIIARVVKTENEQVQESEEGDKVEEVTIVEEKYKAPRLIRAASQKKIPPILEDVVLVTKEARGPVQIDTLPDWNLMHVWRAATGIMDVSSR